MVQAVSPFFGCHPVLSLFSRFFVLFGWGARFFMLFSFSTPAEESLFRVENGAMGGVNGTSDALCGSGSHEHIRADCYELLCT